MNDGFQIYPLMGNHEYFILRDMEFCYKNPSKIRDLIQSKDLLNLEYEIEVRFVNFIKKLPYYYELDEFILVHAGLDFRRAHPLEDYKSMIYARDFNVVSDKINGKTLIHGHTPISLNKIQNQILNHKTNGVINLDNGCVYKKYKLESDIDLGRLCALDLDKMALLYCEFKD